jgi:hypothetical protein
LAGMMMMMPMNIRLMAAMMGMSACIFIMGWFLVWVAGVHQKWEVTSTVLLSM